MTVPVLPLATASAAVAMNIETSPDERTKMCMPYKRKAPTDQLIESIANQPALSGT